MLYKLRYSEIGLKSTRVRMQWENFLINDIKKACNFYGIDASIKKIDGRIVIEGDKFIEEILKEVGGIRSFSPVILTSVDLNEIVEKVREYSSFIKENESFALRVRKAGEHEYSSRDVAVIAGEAVRNERKAKVNLDEPEHEIFIEIRHSHAFIFKEITDGIGGLPYGSQGKVISFVEDMQDIKAAWLMVRRGCYVDFALSCSCEDEIKEMMKWRRHTIFYCNSIHEAEKIALQNNAKAIVTGKNEFIKLSLPVFYPLLGEEYVRNDVMK
ncbi:MAG: hypothetical protein J7K95_07860 [Thermoplasmata archaeon]|nr:hypothetical protein [Thermoplasmata archaeon]